MPLATGSVDSVTVEVKAAAGVKGKVAVVPNGICEARDADFLIASLSKIPGTTVSTSRTTGDVFRRFEGQLEQFLTIATA